MDLQKIGRREFVWTGSAAVGMAMAGTRRLRSAPNGCLADTATSAEDASTIIAGKDSRLLVLTKTPAVFETPLELLRTGQVVPTEFVFVRNNQQPPGTETTDAAPLKGWRLELSGMIKKAMSIDASELDDLEQVEHEMVLQCSGNSRSLFSIAAKVSGTAWGRGGMANVRFGGVRVSQVLEKYGIEPQSSVRYLTAEGIDAPTDKPDDFEHSLPIDDALARSFIALSMNGQPLPAVHGGPLRLVTPGVYGTMHVKWLSRLRFEAEESKNDYQSNNYRVPLHPIKPGTDFKFNRENSSANWNMKVKSVVLGPLPDAILSSGEVVIEGVAFNDGSAKIDSVLVSIDRGQSWRTAKLERNASPFGWSRFRLPIKFSDGRHEVWTLAIDAFGRSQPFDGSIAWNPRGYEWNGVEKIAFTVK